MGTTAGTTDFFIYFFFFIGTRGEKGSLEVLAMGDLLSSCHGGLEGGKEVGRCISVGLWRCTCIKWCSLNCAVFLEKDSLQYTYWKEQIKKETYCNN